MRTSSCLAVAVAAAAASASAAPVAREEVFFGNAWRFHLGVGGDDAGAGPGSSWQAAFDVQTAGPCATEDADPHRFTSTDCSLACAYKFDACLAWRWTGTSCSHSASTAGCTRASSNATADGALRAAATALQTAYSYAAAALPEDASWPIVDAPHDALASANNSFDEAHSDQRHGYRVRIPAWYRKYFVLPADWAGSGVVFLRFEGIVHFAQLWLNGVYLGAHSASYNEFTVRLDNVSAAVFGGRNVLAIRADGSYGSEHWYGGGGLSRDVWLVRTPEASLVEHGVFVPPELPKGSRTARVSAEWGNDGAAAASGAVRFDLFDASGALLVSNMSAPAALAPGNATQTAASVLELPAAVAMWPQGPVPPLYTVVATLIVAGAPVDSVNVSVGWRRTEWTAATGFALNGEVSKLRGFSHHNSFAGVGVAMPQRLDLFRVQASRALGANTWRMSHNPYRKGLYALLDTLGVTLWDENRDFGAFYTSQMSGMVKRGRNHPGIICYSLCNEYECIASNVSVGAEMVALARGLDDTRPTTANSNGVDGLFAVIDVQGLSHASLAKFQAARAAHPDQPLVLSECCSCDSQRLPRDDVNNACMEKENAPGMVPWNAGSLGVWTLFDYFGEPQGPWPFVSSSFGQLDLSGGVKPNAYWYTTNWREGTPASDPSRVPLTPAPVARITELLDQLTIVDGVATIHGIASTASAELICDGVSAGVQPLSGSSVAWSVPLPAPPANASCPLPWPQALNGVQCKGLSHIAKAHGNAACAAAACAAGAPVWQFAAAAGCWVGTPNALPCPPPADGDAWSGGGRAVPPPIANATLVARDAAGAARAVHTLLAPASGAAAALGLSLTVPSPASGTGSALYLDGQDIALVAVRTLDASGALISTAAVNVSFAVRSGPGRIAGIGAGDPTSHEQPNGAVVATFAGVAHALVQVTLDCTSPLRARIIAIDADNGARTTVLPPAAPCPAGAAIVVVASAPGLAPATISIPVSGDAADTPLAAAAAGYATAAVDYVANFLG